MPPHAFRPEKSSNDIAVRKLSEVYDVVLKVRGILLDLENQYFALI